MAEKMMIISPLNYPAAFAGMHNGRAGWPGGEGVLQTG